MVKARFNVENADRKEHCELERGGVLKSACNSHAVFPDESLRVVSAPQRTSKRAISSSFCITAMCNGKVNSSCPLTLPFTYGGNPCSFKNLLTLARSSPKEEYNISRSSDRLRLTPSAFGLQFSHHAKRCVVCLAVMQLLHRLGGRIRAELPLRADSGSRCEELLRCRPQLRAGLLQVLRVVGRDISIWPHLHAMTF